MAAAFARHAPVDVIIIIIIITTTTTVHLLQAVCTQQRPHVMRAPLCHVHAQGVNRQQNKWSHVINNGHMSSTTVNNTLSVRDAQRDLTLLCDM